MAENEKCNKPAVSSKVLFKRFTRIFVRRDLVLPISFTSCMALHEKSELVCLHKTVLKRSRFVVNLRESPGPKNRRQKIFS